MIISSMTASKGNYPLGDKAKGMCPATSITNSSPERRLMARDLKVIDLVHS